MPKKATAVKGGLRDFVERVNSDALFRLHFLVDPVHTLDEAGIPLSEELKSELRTLVHEYVEKYPNIALLPTGLSPEAKKRGVWVVSAGTAEGKPGFECTHEEILIL
jgi:hypothetical protein